jgi:hypothetical protein
MTLFSVFWTSVQSLDTDARTTRSTWKGVVKVSRTLSNGYVHNLAFVSKWNLPCLCSSRSSNVRLAMLQRIRSGSWERELTPATTRKMLGLRVWAIGVSYRFCTFALLEAVPAICIHEGAYCKQKARGIATFWGDERLSLSLGGPRR